MTLTVVEHSLASQLPLNPTITALSLLPDGRLLVGPQTYVGFALDLDTGAATRLGPGGTQDLSSLQAAGDGAPAALVGLWRNEIVFVDFDGRVVERRATGFPKKFTTIERFAMSPDRRHFAVAPSDGVVRLHDLAGDKKWNLKGLSGALLGVCFDPRGERVAAHASGGHVAQVWSVATRKPAATIAVPAPDRPSAALTFTRDGACVVLSICRVSPEGLVSGYDLGVFSAATGALERVVRPALAPVCMIALDDTRLIAASAQTVDGVQRCSVDVLSLDDGSLLGRAEVPALPLALLRLDDRRFVAAGRDGVVRVFSVGAPSTAR